MLKTILVVWILGSTNNIQMQFAVKFNTEEQCQAEANKQKDSRTALIRSYPVRYAECVMEIK